MAGSGGGTRKLTVTVAGDATQMAKAFGKAADDAKGFGEKIKTSLSGPALKAGIAAAAAALGVIAVDGFMRGMDDEAASDKVAAQLVPGEQDMAVLGRVAGEVYAGAWGDSLAEVQSAVAELMKAGVEEVDLGNLTQQVLDISEAFDQDFAEVIRTAQTMVNNGLVPDMESAFDVITRGFQNVGQVGRDELLESLNEYSETFKTLGIDGPTAIGLIDAAIDAGAWSVDKVGDTLKEFSTRVVDGSDGTVAALEALGLNADEVARKITEGGPVAAEALGEVVRALGEVDEEAQNDIGVALFGAMWEDVGKDVVLSLDPAKVAVGDLSSATEDMGSVLNNNLATDVEAFKRVAMQGISDGIYKIAMPAIDAIRDAWADDGFSGVAELAAEKMKDAIKALGEWLKADGAKLIAEFLFVTLPVEIAQAFVAIQKAFLTLTWDALKAMGSGLASGAADHVWPWLKALPGEIVAQIGDLASTLLDKGKDLLSGLLTGIVSIFGSGGGGGDSTVSGFMGGAPAKILSAIGELGGLLLQKGKDLIQGLIDGIKGLLGSAGSGLLGLVFGIPAALVAAFASIGPGTLLSKGADLIQGLISGIASKIPGLTSAIGAAQTAIGAISGGGSTMGSFATGSLGGSKGWSKNTSGAKTSSGRVYASAGIVPGRIGELVPILAHGGEELRPLGSTPSHTDTTGATVFAPVINLHGPTTMADANRVVEALVAYNQTRGPVPVSVRA